MGGCSGGISCSFNDAAVGYLLGATQSKEYAEPEWVADWLLTVVWLAYLAMFLGTIMRRKEKHIYVANWFYLIVYRDSGHVACL